GEATQPDEAVGLVQVAERPDDPVAVLLLALDEVLLEERDQRVALARMERVLAPLHDGAALWHGASLRRADRRARQREADHDRSHGTIVGSARGRGNDHSARERDDQSGEDETG